MNILYIIIPLAILVGLYLFYSNASPGGSNFGTTQEIVEDTYKEPVKEGRVSPSGHLPGSWIMLTDSERKELLKTFVENGPKLE
jgi:hypothetical protein